MNWSLDFIKRETCLGTPKVNLNVWDMLKPHGQLKYTWDNRWKD